MREMREIRVTVDGAILAATYSPAGDCALVAVHGASGGTRDHFLLRHLHRLLPARGIGVVTFDRRGEGASTGNPSRGDFLRQAQDVLAIANAVEVGRVGLWGFSQGGWVAPLSATLSDRIQFLVLLASTGVTPAEQMIYATEQQLRRAGYGGDVVARALSLRRQYEAWVYSPGDSGGRRLAAALQEASTEMWWQQAFLPARLPDAVERAAWHAEMDFDPFPTFAAVRVPALLFYGADDGWSPVEASVEAWRRARGDEAQAVIVDEASHEMTKPDATLAPEYERKLVEWLRAQCGQMRRAGQHPVEHPRFGVQPPRSATSR
jgi:uncharacterized protein